MAEQQVEQQKEPTQEATSTMQRPESEAKGTQLERAPRPMGLRKPEWTSPFSVMRQFMDEIDQLFSGFGFGFPSIGRPRALERMGGVGWSPAIETLTKDDRLVFRVDLPGLRREDVKVEISGDELCISGERTQDEREVKAGGVYSERRYGAFERRIMLPEGCDFDTIEAVFDNGVLEVSVVGPKRKGPTTRAIEVKHGRTPEQGGAESIH